MRQYDRARQQYGISEYAEIPRHMLGDPPEYQQNPVMAEPVVDSDLIMAESSYSVPGSVYRNLKIKKDELEKQLDICLQSYEKKISNEEESEEDIFFSYEEEPKEELSLVSIESKTGWLIDKIILNFNNGKSKEYGGEGGEFRRKIFLKKGEKIVKVEHLWDRGYGDPFLGKKIIFHTTNRQIVIEGTHGEVHGIKSFDVGDQKNLLGLRFERGILVGIEDQEDQEGGEIRRKIKYKKPRKKTRKKPRKKTRKKPRKKQRKKTRKKPRKKTRKKTRKN